MADLRVLLQRAAPLAPDFDTDALLHTIAKRNQPHRLMLTGGAIAIAVLVIVGVTAADRSDRHTIVVSPSSTTTSTSSSRSVPSSTVPGPTTTSTPRQPRATIAPIQTSPMPAEALVATGSSLVAINTHDPAEQRTLT